MVKIPTPKLININELKPNNKNVKQHPKEQIEDLARLMDYVGFKDPIVIDEDYTIFAGHGRLEAAKLKGMTEVPCVFMENLTDEQKKWFLLADNRINESEWNSDNVQLMLEDLGSFTFEDFNMKFDDFEVKIKEETEEVPEPPAEPKAKLGDIYQLGRHRIMCGDSTKDLDKLLDKEIDLLLTDPPYGISVVNNLGTIGGSKPITIGKIGGSNTCEAKYYRPVLNDDKPFEPEFLLKYGKIQILFGGNYYANKLPQKAGWIVWNKRKEEWGKTTFADCELAWTNLDTPARAYTQVWMGLIKDGETGQKRVHPTQKPIRLLSELIIDHSKKSNIVLDCYLGSGSTLIACEQTNRICYGMELDPAYIDVIIERYINYAGTDKDVYLITNDQKTPYSEINRESTSKEINQIQGMA